MKHFPVIFGSTVVLLVLCNEIHVIMDIIIVCSV